MTAEVGVMNRLGVALAADSAVTIGDARKVYSSADKLFQLCTGAPIAVMTYGNATYLDLPWEMVIKVFRARNGARTFPHLEDYASAFFDYVAGHTPPFPAAGDNESTRRLLGTILFDLRDQIKLACDTAAEERNGLDQNDIAAIIDDAVGERLEEVMKRELLPGFSEDDRSKAGGLYSEIIAELRAQILGHLPISPSATETLDELLCQALIRNYMGPGNSGIVIAGFGDDDYFPGILHYKVEGRTLDRIRRRLSNAHKINNETEALIVPFAQSDAAATFLEGVAPQLTREMETSVRALFQGTKDAIVEHLRSSDANLAKSLHDQLSPALDGVLTNLFKGWRGMRQRFWSPVLDMVEALPKDEIAAAAEALVNLTKFRRKVTPVHESVGGPIDVALITKGDGFVWVKRKHYFTPELNPRVIGRLQKGI